jgi:enoyl-CoA hydratase
MDGSVDVAVSNAVAVVRMTQPERKNAMSTAMLAALLTGLRGVASDSAARSAVLTGSGGVFSSGADVSEEVDASGASKRMDLFCEVYEEVVGFPKPLVAAITGHCIGGGAEVAAGCDLRVGTPDARIRFPGAVFGIPVGGARLPLLIGLSHAKDLLLTSRTLGGEEAHRIGFLNRLVAEGDLIDEAVSLASQIAANPGAVKQKRLIDQYSHWTARTYSENRQLRSWQNQATTLMGDVAEGDGIAGTDAGKGG